MESEESYLTFHVPFSTFSLFVFPVQLMLAAATAKLLELEPIWLVLFVLCRHVVALFALRALQNNVISGHYLKPRN